MLRVPNMSFSVQLWTLIALISHLSAQEQQPVIPRPPLPFHLSPATSFSDIAAIESAGRNATIRLYPAASPAIPYSVFDHCQEREFNTISLAPDTCLSGDYHPNKNIKINEAPICPSGETPTLVYYHNGGCTGEPKYTSLASHDVIYSCLWSGRNPRYWSLIFRCSVWPAAVQGADAYVDAIPPAAPGNVKPQDAVVTYGLAPACSVPRLGGEPSLYVPVDACLATPGYAIRIREPAFCPNGTRARIARFEDASCGGGSGTLSPRYGLIDFYEGNLMQCMSTGRAAQSNTERFRSLMFWCDGFGSTAPPLIVPPKLPPARAWIDTPFQRPYSFNPDVDTCFNLKDPRLRIYSPGVCSDGAFAHVALYSRSNCNGPPHVIKDPLYMGREGEFNGMQDFEGTVGIAFLCNGLDASV